MARLNDIPKMLLWHDHKSPQKKQIVISWHKMVISWHDIIISWHDTIISCCVWFEAMG